MVGIDVGGQGWLAVPLADWVEGAVQRLFFSAPPGRGGDVAGTRRPSAKREWARQDRLLVAAHRREDELRATQATLAHDYRRNLIQQGVSAVDQILAYWQAAVAISESQPPYHEGFAAIVRFRENVLTLRETLLVMRGRPDLADGLLFTMVSADRIADGILRHTSPPENGQGHNWPQWVHNLNGHRALVEMTQARNDDVRADFQLGPSASAEAIRTKYTALANAITQALASQGIVDMTAVPQNHF